MDYRDRDQIFMGLYGIKGIFGWQVTKPEKQRHNAASNGHNAKASNC